MKYVFAFCLLWMAPTVACGQEPGADRTQVRVQLQIAEISLTRLQELGVDFSRVAGDSGAKPNLDRASFNAQWSAITRDGQKAQQLLQILQKDALAKILAEPTLLAMSGKTAVFTSGDELSVPKRQPDGSVAMEREHGIVVKVTPEVLGDRVDLSIHGVLSELDYAHTVRVGKENVPGVQTSEFDTRTELASGQTLALSGPTRVRIEALARGVPYISELPVVGALFRRVEEERNDIALLILVRPEIVLAPAETAASAGAGLHGETPAAQAATLHSQGFRK